MSNTNAIIVAPYVGEFGWELMTWQARVRLEIRTRKSTVFYLCAAPDRRALYCDLIDGRRVRFCPMSKVDWPGHANDDHRILDGAQPVSPDAMVDSVQLETTRILGRIGVATSRCSWMMPSYRSHLWPTTTSNQDFKNLRAACPIEVDVILVPRRRSFAEDRNLPDEWWASLEGQLTSYGLRVETLTNRLDLAIRQLSTARLAIGASTGGLHLASLCGCPHYVWGSGAERRWTRMEITNRQRYETVWNPLGTPCLYDEVGWQPSVEHVFDAATSALDRIGLKSHVTGVSPRKSARWIVKRGLARIIEWPASESRWPWRMRELVRKYMV